MKKIIFHILIFVTGLQANFSIAQTITSFVPTWGPVGSAVTISGTGFNTIPANNIIFFGATRATVTAATTTTLNVIVPSGANFLYITVTNLSTHLTAYSAKPFNVANSCSHTPTFGAELIVQGGSHNVEICDIDGDGKADLIIADYFNNTFTVTRNTSTPGNISFATKVAFPWAAGGQPNEVSIGDFDGDGKPDVAVGGNGGGTFVSAYRNTSTPGNISFAARQDFAASSGQGNGNKIIDIDLDGKPDLVSVHWSGNCMWVLRNTSTGPGVISFATGVSFATTSQPHKIDVGDLDGDNKPEVVITCFTSNTLSLFRNTSTPGIISFASRQDFAPGAVPYYLHIGDLDGDGKADIALANRDVATLAVYRNTSTPGNISLAARKDFATPAGTMTHYGIAYGDLDGDGRPDITVANYNLHNTSIFINTSVPGLITFAPRVDLFVSLASMDVGIDDLDGDGRPDLAITKGGSTVSIFGNLCTLIPLPIELISFSAENKNNINHLTWTTTSETDNDYFEVERSADGINFETIGKVNGAGSTVQVKHYSFDDKKNIYGVIYYRLKQVDFNGNNKYSNIISIENKRQDIFCSVNPTDVNGIFILHCSELNSASIKLLDTEGKEIAEKRNVLTSELVIDLSSYKKGLYFLRVFSSEKNQTIKIVNL